MRGDDVSMLDHWGFSGLDNLSWFSSVAAITARLRLLVVMVAIFMVPVDCARSEVAHKCWLAANVTFESRNNKATT